jgi:hypothetical protein
MDDEYSFTDEDDEPEIIATTSSIDQLKEQKLEAEVAQKLARISTMHPELRATAQQRLAGAGQFVPGQPPPNEQQQQDLWRHVVPKKRHNTTVNSSLDRPTVPSTPLLPPAPVPEAPPSVDARSQASRDSVEPDQRIPLTAAQQLAETLRRRRERRSANSFVRTEICLDDTSTAKPTPPLLLSTSMATSMSRIKEEPASDDEQPSSFLQPHSELLSKTGEGPPLPKVIIRIPKRCISQSSHRSSEDGQDRKKKKKKKHKYRDEHGERRHKKKKQKKQKRRADELHGFRRSPSSDRDSETEDPMWQPGSQKTPSAAPSAVFNKKKRLMQWNDESTASNSEQTTVERNSSGKKDKKHHHKKSKRLLDRRDSIEDMAAQTCAWGVCKN